MYPEIELVDINDNIIGYGQKMDIHTKGLLHRAFSIFIYDLDQNKILLQKRAKDKYHSGGLWSNSCCSHKYRNESWIDGFKRCINDELMFMPKFDEYVDDTNSSIILALQNQKPILAGKFKYFSNYGNINEHEIDRVIVWGINTEKSKDFQANPAEVSDICWVSISQLNSMLKNKYMFTSWFVEAYSIAESVLLRIVK